MRARVGLLVLVVSGLVLAGSAAAAVPSSLPGADLVPIRGMAYQPAPSDYAPCGCGAYFDTDFFNDDFAQLWDDANGGRGDLKTMADQLHVNFLHLYNWNPQRNHLSALNRAASLGIKVAVPISNFFVDPGQDPNAAADIEKIMRSVYVDQNGNPSTTPHPAVGMILIANEPENGAIQNSSPANPNTWQDPVVQAMSSMRAAEQAIGATRLLPVSVPFAFSIDNYDANANNPDNLAAVGQIHSLQAAMTAALGADFVKTRYVAATNPQNPGSFMSSWIPQFKQSVPDTPLWFSEQGTGVAKSCLGYQNCTPSEQQQAVFNADQFAATKPNTEDVVLGGAQFEWSNESWKSGDNEPTFGIYKFNGQFRTVPTSGGSYRVDDLVQKPSWNALHDAFNPSPAPAAVVGASGSGGGASSSASSTGTIPTVVPPAAGSATLPDNRFSVRRGATALNRRGTVATLSFVAPGPGRFSVRELSAGASRASARNRARRHVRSRRTRARRAGTVHVRLRLTSAGRAALARRGRLPLRLRVGFKPDGGITRARTVRLTVRP